MKNTLRIALPELEEFGADSPLPYAWFDRRGRCARQGEMTLHALGHAYPQAACEAVLHPADVIAATVQIPAVPRARFAAAVRSALEPLVLSDLDALAIGHGPRAADGSVALAWSPRVPVRRAWGLLNAQGLRVNALIAPQTLAPETAAPLRDPADPRWLAPSPSWSLAMPQLAPVRVSRWRPVWRWGAAAAIVWIAGLNLHASQLRGEADALRNGMREQVLAAFPSLPVVLDPARQAQQGLDALLANRGAAGAADFLPLARAAAQTLPFAADKVARLTYADQALTLQLADAGAQSQRVAETPALIQQAAALGLKLERGDTDNTWRIVRNQP
ncbi:type II secretion system protein GspL [Achromobacter deleyi]|uniref:type II secretion system protein GspL n=1 Tax=Achromobacter deleyi TaxID=1353891 RepID=UPI0014926381|nr:type II secretion system protein GspL [Achromobacter deleyi]QVQ28828.1 general secretion pathway protein GspL [Achromobacter deleyi]UIP18943.1 type II secretion system protein GspL [Achromobacter deleyi]